MVTSPLFATSQGSRYIQCRTSQFQIKPPFRHNHCHAMIVTSHGLIQLVHNAPASRTTCLQTKSASPARRCSTPAQRESAAHRDATPTVEPEPRSLNNLQPKVLYRAHAESWKNITPKSVQVLIRVLRAGFSPRPLGPAQAGTKIRTRCATLGPRSLRICRTVVSLRRRISLQSESQKPCFVL